MAQIERPTVDHLDSEDAVDRLERGGGVDRLSGNRVLGERSWGEECGAREALKSQVSRLERDLSVLVAQTFPHVSPADPDGETFGGPRLLTLGELERLRDRLALRVTEVRREVAERKALERRSRELLERMKLEPGRYKFTRVAVADLGDGHCGVWEARPRLGLIGMLAGWWQVKLSSGCP